MALGDLMTLIKDLYMIKAVHVRSMFIKHDNVQRISDWQRREMNLSPTVVNMSYQKTINSEKIQKAWSGGVVTSRQMSVIKNF